MDPNNPRSTSTARTLGQIKFCAIVLSAMMLAGIVGLMILSAGKGEDITGIVAPALLIALLSGVAAAVTAVMQKRAKAAGSNPPRAQ
jgi:hypothetical protein